MKIFRDGRNRAAALAFSLDATLVTDNERELSRITGLKIEN